ncbi:bifunctional phosphopantothenoylcysteine decarboxylase/phosphopantothenate--cysteine ligase CoaBC [Pyruvatibacter sp.]|uniref:bifunctional phosphopantothenoylcysteine decarboxylase/phosphopantothenate--cysteine ligase CoaBC n=1 Tax=Pyruvatibacter sp. TaxID=1981328 RepID=UPI0032EE216A
MLDGKRILLIIGGGIAAYKSLELARLIRRRNGEVRAILTKAGQEFVTPLSVGGLTHDKVYTDLFDLTAEADMGHIQLSRDADLLVVSPATADLMAKIAQGRADDMASTALLATDKPVLIAPAMNVRMWEHPATQRNLAQLIADGVSVVGPREGSMACGEFGPGRLAEPEDILAAIEQQLGGSGVLAGRRAIVTAGPTHEPIDPVRYIANRSSGKQGYAIAQALAQLGAETHLVSGPTSLADPRGVRVTRVETAREMLAATQACLPADVAVCAAAVADWRADTSTNSKLKKDGTGAVPPLALIENPDILATLSSAGPDRPRLVIGFAAETDDVVAHATAKRQRKGCDWIVANDVSPGTGIMGGDSNTVHLISASGTENWAPMPKAQVATQLAARVADALGAMS